jgi:hypothetical protein
MTPLAAVKEAHKRNARYLKGEPIIAKDLDQSLIYARDIIKGRFELAEPLFATSPYHSLQYASNILDRFELGEPIIATNPRYAFLYAHMVLGERFTLGESIIATDLGYAFKYSRDVIKGRFYLAEPIIATSPDHLYYYLTEIPNTYNIELVSILLKSRYKSKYVNWYFRKDL